jgi:sterol desaturase/sphingolipid hydroxylase (fatty acid hydroxylase superfamily)
VHLVHHRSNNPSPWAAYCFHPYEALIDAAIYPLIVFTMPIHKFALIVFLSYSVSRIFLGHLGIEILPKWFLKIPFLNLHTTTTHHDLHHKHFDTNYALYFIWWDKWFGTVDGKYVKTFEEVASREKK